MTTVVTYDAALAALRKLDPAYVYTEVYSMCQYTYDGAPACGVGQIMHRDFNVSIEFLNDWDNARDSEFTLIAAHLQFDSETHDDALDYQNIEVEQRAVALLAEFQRCQDNDASWGVATDQAEAYETYTDNLR